MNPLSSACVVGGKNASKRILFPLSLSTFIYLSWGKCMPQFTSGGQRTGCGNRSSHSAMWATGFELRLSVLAASAFTHGAISPALGLIFFLHLQLCSRSLSQADNCVLSQVLFCPADASSAASRETLSRLFRHPRVLIAPVSQNILRIYHPCISLSRYDSRSLTKSPVKKVGNACLGWDGQDGLSPLAQL